MSINDNKVDEEIVEEECIIPQIIAKDSQIVIISEETKAENEKIVLMNKRLCRVDYISIIADNLLLKRLSVFSFGLRRYENTELERRMQCLGTKTSLKLWDIISEYRSVFTSRWLIQALA